MDPLRHRSGYMELPLARGTRLVPGQGAYECEYMYTCGTRYGLLGNLLCSVHLPRAGGLMNTGGKGT